MAYNCQTPSSSSTTESSKQVKTAFAIGLVIMILLSIMYSLFSFDQRTVWKVSLVPLIELLVLLLMYLFLKFYNKSHAPPQEDAVTHLCADQECTRERPDEQEESNALPDYEEVICSIRFPLVYFSAPSTSDLPTYEELERTQGNSTVEPSTPPPQYEDKGPEYSQLPDYTFIGGDQYVLEQENGQLQFSSQ